MTNPNPLDQQPPGAPLGPPQAPSRQSHFARMAAIAGGIAAALVGLTAILNATTDLKQSLINLIRPSANTTTCCAPVSPPPSPVVSPSPPPPLTAADVSVTCTVSPAPRLGRMIEMTYTITSKREGRVDLGADVYDDEQRSNLKGFDDIDSYLVQVDEQKVSRELRIPAKLAPGDYEVVGELWPAGRKGRGETITDATCATLSVP